MKKQQLAAMMLSVLSAGILISCAKPNDETVDAKKADAQAQAVQSNAQKADADETLSTEPTSVIPMTSDETTAYLKSVAKDQIVPAYQNVASQSQQLNTLAAEHCQSGGTNAEQLEQLQAQWLALAKAWATAEMINFGPAMDSMSNLYINYYPDERGLVHNGVVDLIAANPSLLPEQLAQESAVVQGIPGLEEVLYTNDTLNASQCQYVITASAALTQRLTEVQTAWQQSPMQLLAGDDKDNTLGMNRWINSLLSLVETTKSSGLDKPLGLTGAKKGHLPAAAAGHSRDIINAKVAALNRALTDADLVAIMAEHGQDTLTDELSTILAEISTLMAQLPEDIKDAKPEQQQLLYDKLTDLTRVIKRQLMPVLGVQVGFNSTDGD